MATKPGKRGRGRPRKEFDLEQVEALARIGCTDEEIGTILGCASSTIRKNKRQSEQFAAALQNGRANRRASLRRKQTQLALEGNVTMLIWLGKQDLAQRDRHDLQHGGQGDGPPIKVQVIKIGDRKIQF